MSKTEPSLIRLARESGGDRSLEPLNLEERVRSLRKSRGWTLEQAAKQAGLARSTLSKIENGQMSPTYDALKKLAVGLDRGLWQGQRAGVDAGFDRAAPDPLDQPCNLCAARCRIGSKPRVLPLFGAANPIPVAPLERGGTRFAPI